MSQSARQHCDPHLTLEWFDLLQRAAVPDGSVIIYCPIGPESDPAVSLLPMLRLSNDPYRLKGLSTFYTPLFAPINELSLCSKALESCFAEFRRQSRTAIINLAPLDPNGLFFSTAHIALRQAGWLTDTYFCFGNWYALLEKPDFGLYFTSLPSRLRNTVKRARKKLDKNSTFALTIQTDLDAHFDEAVNEFVAVYNHSWKRPEPYPYFIPELCKLAANHGWLRLGILRLDAQPVAAQIWLVCAGTAYIVKLAYHQSYAKCSVGSVLTAHLMQHVINVDKVVEIDYLIGDDAYKRDWTPLRRERYGIVAFNMHTVRGCLAALRHFAGHFWHQSWSRILTGSLIQ
ncbi:MAG: GNAT family N-acetyltransferase [Gammaproteobacteria bacterium]|nr:GNAT family N-acetyltransferase [Gammaproteobacteria bacterium]MCP5196501.1 GNAT family N-acetyltransferase [Gammaproteobacteria bacterium]